MDALVERALSFGPDGRLAGILSHRSGDGEVACLLLNVGVTRRSGPRRLNVKLARALGAMGVATLRFDLSGIGDSAPAPGGGDYRTQSVDDLRAAMDAVQRETGIARFCVLGICSGAVNGYRVAETDARVRGLLLYDGHAYPTWRTHLVHDWTRLRTTRLGAVLGKALRRLGRRLGLRVATPATSIFAAQADRSAPDRAAYAAALDAMVARGTRVLVMFSGSALQHYNHAGQFAAVFGDRPLMAGTEVVYRPDLDHIPTTQAAQAAFIAIVTDWVARTVVHAAPPRSLVLDGTHHATAP